MHFWSVIKNFKLWLPVWRFLASNFRPQLHLYTNTKTINWAALHDLNTIEVIVFIPDMGNYIVPAASSAYRYKNYNNVQQKSANKCAALQVCN